MNQASNRERENILGVGLSPVNMQITLSILDGWIRAGERRYVCLAAVHSLMNCQGDPELGAIFNQSGLTTPDGMPLVWILRMRGHRRISRVYGPDLMLAACHRFREDGLGHYFLGGKPGVPEELAKRLVGRIPGLNVVGVKSPPFRELTTEEDAQLVEDLNAAGADFLWVALGSPRQERWMSVHRDQLEAPVLIGVGAAFDFLAGAKPQAPTWIQRAGLEWAFRLATEPGRLWPRYRQYPLFILLVLAEALGLRKFPLAADQSASLEGTDDGIEA